MFLAISLLERSFLGKIFRDKQTNKQTKNKKKNFLFSLRKPINRNFFQESYRYILWGIYCFLVKGISKEILIQCKGHVLWFQYSCWVTFSGKYKVQLGLRENAMQFPISKNLLICKFALIDIPHTDLFQLSSFPSNHCTFNFNWSKFEERHSTKRRLVVT